MAACVNPHRTVQEKADGTNVWIYCSQEQAHKEAVGSVLSASGILLGITLMVVALAVGTKR